MPGLRIFMHPLLKLQKYGCSKIYGSRHDKSHFILSQKDERTKQAKKKLKKLNRMIFFIHSKEKKLELLREAAELKMFNKVPYLQRRREFDRMKWQFHSNWILCKVCQEKTVKHIHHIIQLQHGGTNQMKNIIGLCFDCHAEIHPWLKVA